jgi:flagellar hook-length control protein FliK
MDQLRQMGRVEARLDLHPPELGRMQLHLAMEDGHMNLRLVVQNDAVKRLMEAQQEPLRVRFADMGVSVGQFDVRRDGGSPNDQRPSSSEPSAQPIQAETAGPLRPRKAHARVANPSALVDVVA